MTELAENISNFIWSRWMIGALIALGIFMTYATKGIQFRKFLYAIKTLKNSITNKNNENIGDISSFQSFTTALAGTVGNSNIAGVATAISIGGPGAAFWMVIIAPLGMATKFVEAFLSLKYRVQLPDGKFLGGPMLYIEKGAKAKWLGFSYALFAVLAAIGGGNLSQSNSIALVMNSQFGIPKAISGILIALLIGAIIRKGVTNIGPITEKVVPLMTIIYMSCVIIIISINITLLPDTLMLIIKSAFNPIAPAGGFAGVAVVRTIEYGIRRGVISNEAGLGSAGIAHSAAKAKDPYHQGLIAMIGVFIDTIVICFGTAIVVVITGVWSNGQISTALVASAFDTVIPFGGSIVAVCSMLFGFTTMTTWSYYGEQTLRYIIKGNAIVPIFRILWCLLAYIGAIYGAKLIWDISDILVGLVALPNIIGLCLLYNKIKVINDS